MKQHILNSEYIMALHLNIPVERKFYWVCGKSTPMNFHDLCTYLNLVTSVPVPVELEYPWSMLLRQTVKKSKS
jgi:hypothetical protein